MHSLLLSRDMVQWLATFRCAGNVHELWWCEAAAAGVDGQFLWAATSMLSGAHHGEVMNEDRGCCKASEYRYHPLGIDTPCKTHKLEYSFYTEYRYPPMSIDTLLREYRYPKSSIDTLCCKSAFIVGRKLPNGSYDDLTYQNGWKSVRGYKNKLLKLQQQ
ncbi:hypothetical protein GQ457_01G013330 [Hibiscus cannabinus]